LPFTESEAVGIRDPLKQYLGEGKLDVLLGPEAATAVLRGVEHPKVLVLGTHGFFRPLGPEARLNPLNRCGLLFAGFNSYRTNRNQQLHEDGLLTGEELLYLDLEGTELVVLSACQTALGDVSNGEGTAGLRQAFQLAGARAVLATLWQVEDRQTAQLMTSFFANLAQQSDSARALRDAQLEQVRRLRDKEGFAHPFYWAAQTLTGP
jgi:CHAT domain-containing protein